MKEDLMVDLILVLLVKRTLNVVFAFVIFGQHHKITLCVVGQAIENLTF
jgi:hypothetical protein